MSKRKEMPEFCEQAKRGGGKCGSRQIASYLDTHGRTVRKFSCGAVLLECAPGGAMPIKSCPHYIAAMNDLKLWVNTQR